MFLIYKSWYDGMVSLRQPDSGYDLVGFVHSEEEAGDIVRKGGIDARSTHPQPYYKYEELEELIWEC